MDREEFDKTNHFGGAKCCLICGWIHFETVKPEAPYRPTIWRCRLMQELGVSEAGSVIVKPEDFSCGRYEV